MGLELDLQELALLSGARDPMLDVFEAAAREFEAAMRPRELSGDGLLDFVPRISRKFQRPDHLRPLVDVIERAVDGEPVRALVSVPPRHGKTEVVLHGIAWALDRRPDVPMMYVGYSDKFALSKSRMARDYALSAGIRLRDDANSLHEWRTYEGGGLLAMGIGGGLTGHGAQIVFVDDPIKNRAEADSPTIQERNYDWFRSAAMTRLEPTGSAIVIHTRWGTRDLIGRLLEERKLWEDTEGKEGEPWEHINLQAIDDETDEVLWPARWSREYLTARRRIVGEYDWAALFQGQPRPKGSKLFRSPARYESRDISGKRLLIGVDVAATKRTRADWTVAVVFAFWGDSKETLRCDVVEILRMQEEIPAVCRELLALQARYSGTPMVIEASGVGKGVPQTLLDQAPRLNIIEVYPQEDKFARSQAYAAAWNQGRVRIAQKATHVEEFVRVHEDFTGVRDAIDDDVDAGAHAFNYALEHVGSVNVIPPPEHLPINLPAHARPRFSGRGGF